MPRFGRQRTVKRNDVGCPNTSVEFLAFDAKLPKKLHLEPADQKRFVENRKGLASWLTFLAIDPKPIRPKVRSEKAGIGKKGTSPSPAFELIGVLFNPTGQSEDHGYRVI